MNPKKNASLIIINDNILNNNAGDVYSSFFISNLFNLGYRVSRVTIIPCECRIITQEITLSNREYELTFIVSNLSKGVTYNTLVNLLGQPMEKNKQLIGILKKNKDSCSENKEIIPSCFNVIEGETYPLVHLQRIFLIHDKFIESIFRSILKQYLVNYNKTRTYEKVANIYLNGNQAQLDNLKEGDVSFQLTKSSCNTVLLNYQSESLDCLLEFEETLRQLVFVSSSKPFLRDDMYSDSNTLVKETIQILETCFEKYKPENTFISFNGGKDCTVLLHALLVVLEKCYPCYNKMPVCFYVKGEKAFPEQDEFVLQCQQFYNLDIITLQTDIKSALEIILHDYPNLKACVMGTRRTDPFSQDLNHFQMTDKGYPEVMRVSPLLNWSYHHIWDFLLYYKIPYCSLYDKGYTSLGNEDNTIKNSNLLYKDIDGKEKYLPAHKLLKADSERIGRQR